MPRIYNAWPGRNRFLPCGCIMGPLGDMSANLCVYFMILGALIPYCIFVLGDIWQISPAIPILLFISVIVLILFLNLTQCTDPGIIPRRTFLQSNPAAYEKYLKQNLNNPQQAYRFCSTCKIFRPPRASHCSTCDNCIQVFDHHCPFVNNCIGKRNYRFFVCFLGSVMLTIVALVVNLIVFFIARSGNNVNSVVLIIVCSVIVGIIGLPLLGFFIFHLYLIITGRTTRQIIKQINQQKNENQWCQVDPPLINYFQQVSTQKVNSLRVALKTLQFTPESQIKNMQTVQMRSEY